MASCFKCQVPSSLFTCRSVFEDEYYEGLNSSCLWSVRCSVLQLVFSSASMQPRAVSYLPVITLYVCIALKGQSSWPFYPMHLCFLLPLLLPLPRNPGSPNSSGVQHPTQWWGYDAFGLLCWTLSIGPSEKLSSIHAVWTKTTSLPKR